MPTIKRKSVKEDETVRLLLSLLNALEPKMAKIPHTKIKQPSFGEKRPKSTYAKISRFTEVYSWSFFRLLVSSVFSIPM
jgi:hypothetical protein